MQFTRNDWGLVKLQPYRQQSVANRLNFKLSKRFYGPFQITDRVGQVAYKLLLPQESKIHPVFNVSLLKLYKGDRFNQHQLDLPSLSFNNRPIPEPASVLQARQIISQGEVVNQVLIKWKGLLEEDNSWENIQDIKQLFPNFNLEDKVILGGDSIDMVGERKKAQKKSK